MDTIINNFFLSIDPITLTGIFSIWFVVIVFVAILDIINI